MYTQTQPAEFLTAMRSIKAAKNIFLLLVLLGLLIQIGAVVAVRWGGVIDDSSAVHRMKEKSHARAATRDADTDEAPPANTDENTEADTDQQNDGDENGEAESDAPDASKPVPAGKTANTKNDEMAELWVVTLRWILPGSKFVIVTSMTILAIILMFATMLAINARESGVAGIISAALWSLLLLAIVIPWQQALNSTVACGATYNLGELMQGTREILPRWGARSPETLESVLYYVRFLGYPCLAVLIWLVVQIKFARGFGRMMRVALGEEERLPGNQPEYDEQMS